MIEFFTRYRNVSVLVGVLLLQFVLLGYQVKRQDDVRLLRVWTVAAISPIEKALNAVSSFAGSLWSDYVWLVDARSQNHQLREQVSRLKLENQQFREALARFQREEKILAYQEKILSETVPAEVIGRGSNPNSKEIFVDKGSRHGVKAGMAVITPAGIVGSVRAAYGGASLVRLINDNDSGVGVLLAGSRAQGVMKGTSSAECRIYYIGEEVSVQVGENVYTSGNDRVFPKGLSVGTVTRVAQRSDYQEIHMKPLAALNRLEEVLIITSGVHQELPDSPRLQTPQYLMPLPPPPAGDAAGGEPSPEKISGHEDPEKSGVSSGNETRPHAPLPLTDADRLKQRYRATAAAQGHVFGEGQVGSPAPDFNFGVAQAPNGAAEEAELGNTPPAPKPGSAASSKNGTSDRTSTADAPPTARAEHEGALEPREGDKPSDSSAPQPGE